MPPVQFDLAASAYREMLNAGFDPDFSPAVVQQVNALRTSQVVVNEELRDLRNLLWSSIDNDTSRDLDQIEVAEPTPEGIKILIGIADVDNDVPIDSPVDRHAAAQATTVYTPLRTFPMLPEALSTDLTSLNPNSDRLAVVVEFVVGSDGALTRSDCIAPPSVTSFNSLTTVSVCGWRAKRLLQQRRDWRHN